MHGHGPSEINQRACKRKNIYEEIIILQRCTESLKSDWSASVYLFTRTNPIHGFRAIVSIVTAYEHSRV